MQNLVHMVLIFPLWDLLPALKAGLSCRVRVCVTFYISSWAESHRIAFCLCYQLYFREFGLKSDSKQAKIALNQLKRIICDSLQSNCRKRNSLSVAANKLLNLFKDYDHVLFFSFMVTWRGYDCIFTVITFAFVS